MKPSKIKMLRLEGSPKERGRIHGETLSAMILEVLERYKYLLKLTLNENPDSEIDRFIEETNFKESIEKWAPQLLKEVEGIAEGAGIDFKEIYAMHLAAHDEKWWFTQKWNGENCTSLGSHKVAKSPAYLAQNMDLHQLFEGLEVLLHIKYQRSDMEALVLSHAGFLAECGVNNRPVGICCNSLTSHLKNSIDGLPVTFIVRSVLEQSNLNDAIKFIRGINHASGQNYMIGGSERIICLECSANKVSEFIPFEGSKHVYHTNHPIVNDDLINPKKKRRYRGTTEKRFDYIKTRLDKSESINLQTIKNILSSHFGPVCVHHNYQALRNYTFSSVIYELKIPASLHITVGPPCLNKYEKFVFEEEEKK